MTSTPPAVGRIAPAGSTPDPDLSLPAGESLAVTTDDGARLAVTVAGRAAEGRGGSPAAHPVVLPHCWTGSRAVWAPVARRLVDAGHPVVLYDQRGHGDSTLGRHAISVDRLGADLGTVLDHLDLRDAVLAGHSMGGMTVMAHACRQAGRLGERARGLVLVATAAHGLGNLQPAMRAGLWALPVERMMEWPWLGCALVRGTFGVDPHRVHVDATRVLFAATPRAVRQDCLGAMRAMDLRDGLRTVEVPAVVVLGTVDRLVPNALTRAIVDHLPGAHLVELRGAGHMLPFERPDELAAVVATMAGDPPVNPRVA